MIRMINGCTRIGNMVISAKDGAVSLSESVEKRLVEMHAAVYEDEPAIEQKEESVPYEKPDSDIHTAEELPADEETLSGMTLTELKAYAEEHHIDCGKARKKAEYISCILDDTDGYEDDEFPGVSVEEPIV